LPMVDDSDEDGPSSSTSSRAPPWLRSPHAHLRVPPQNPVSVSPPEGLGQERGQQGYSFGIAANTQIHRHVNVFGNVYTQPGSNGPVVQTNIQTPAPAYPIFESLPRRRNSGRSPHSPERHSTGQNPSILNKGTGSNDIRGGRGERSSFGKENRLEGVYCTRNHSGEEAVSNSSDSQKRLDLQGRMDASVYSAIQVGTLALQSK
jgi:hypothetical protein